MHLTSPAYRVAARLLAAELERSALGEAGEPATKRQRLESVVPAQCPRPAACEAGSQGAASGAKAGGAAAVAVSTTPFITEIQQQQGQRIWQGLRRRPWRRRPWRAWQRRQPRKELEPRCERRKRKVNANLYGSARYFCIILVLIFNCSLMVRNGTIFNNLIVWKKDVLKGFLTRV